MAALCGRFRTVTFAAITSTGLGPAAEVTVGTANGLDDESAVDVDGVLTIDHRSPGRRIGVLLDGQERALLEALINAFDLDDQAGKSR